MFVHFLSYIYFSLKYLRQITIFLQKITLISCIFLYFQTPAYSHTFEIVELNDLHEVENLIEKSGKKATIFVGIGDTIITPKSKMFRVDSPYHDFIKQIEQTKSSIHNTDIDKILDTLYSSRNTMLVSNYWPLFIDKIKQNKHIVYGLTGRRGGPSGNIEKMEDWHSQTLKKFGINLSPTYYNKVEMTIIPQVYSKNKQNPAIFYQGIFMTGSYNKNEVIMKFLETHYPTQIVFIDDKKDHVIEIGNVCRERNVNYLGIVYRGIELFSEKPDNRVVAIQKEQLFSYQRWLEDEEAERYLQDEK